MKFWEHVAATSEVVRDLSNRHAVALQIVDIQYSAVYNGELICEIDMMCFT